MSVTKHIALPIAGGLLALGVWAAVQASAQVGRREEPKNRWQCEPVVVYDVSGETLLGSEHAHLVVYNNGSAALSADPAVGESRVASKRLEPGAVQELVTHLQAANAWKLEDQQNQVMDVPLTSVTVFRGETDATAHTFNYWLPQDEYAAVQKAIDGFLLAHFEE